MGMIQSLLVRANRWHSVRSYQGIIANKRKVYAGDYEMALIASIGCLSREEFVKQGDAQIAVLVHHGLRDGMSVYDLGCGCGRTAGALLRSGWTGQYKGADIVRQFTDHLTSTCPGYSAVVHRDLTIAAPDASLDMIFHWSVFTHLYPEESYLYMQDAFRALKPGGKLVFSFLEMEDEQHHQIFHNRVSAFRSRGWASTLDAFLHRDWIRFWARDIGFENVAFTDGSDGQNHPQFWQALVVMTTPV